MPRTSARLHLARWPLPQSMLFMGCAIVWGLVIVLVTGMFLNPVLNPVDVDLLWQMWVPYRVARLFGWLPATATFAAAISLAAAAALRFSSRAKDQREAMTVLPFAHAVVLGVTAFTLTSGTISTFTLISCTTWPPPYDQILLAELITSGHSALPGIVLVIISIGLMPTKHLRFYLKSASMLWLSLGLIAGTSVLDALLLLHLTPNMDYPFHIWSSI